MELMYKKLGNPLCVHCNMSGTSIMFIIRYRESRPVTMVLTHESIHMLSAYSKSVCASMNMTSSLVASSSTKLKIQPPLHVSRSTALSLYGNGSIQVCSSPHNVESVVSCMHNIINVVMDTEMILFLEMMRAACM